MSGYQPPEFLTNDAAAGSVADGLNDYLAHLRGALKEPPELAVASAYFNQGGFSLLADELEQIGPIRFLLGAEPTDVDGTPRRLGQESVDPHRARRERIKRALEGHDRSLASARDLLGFTREEHASGRRLIAWLRSGQVEVRRLEDEFLHGKAWLVAGTGPGAIAGSSNFTYAGLARNVELNLGNYQPTTVSQVSGWFDDLWARATPYDLAALYESRYEPHEPYVVYLRMLRERYGRDLEDEAGGTTPASLTGFQRDGVWRARRILERRKGVVIADEVGLGKTFIAGALLEEAVRDRRQRAVVVAPAALRDGMWTKFLLDRGLGVETVSYEQLAGDAALDPDKDGHALRYDPNDYALVVVDEAHNLRNRNTERSDALHVLLGGSPQKNVILLTATPVNNSLWDLYELLAYFLRSDAAFLDRGIGSLRDHFAVAMAEDPDDLTPAHLFDVLDEVAVRRTRKFVKRYYPGDTLTVGGQQVHIVFPTPRVLKVAYDLDAALPGFFDKFARALDDPTPGSAEVLTLARYAPSRYRRGGLEADAHELQLAGLIRSGLLKRFESSEAAFCATCRRMAAHHDEFLSLLGEGFVATGRTLADWVATDTDDLDDFLDLHRDDLDPATDYEVDQLRADVEADRDLLLAFATEVEPLTSGANPKLDVIVEELAAIAAEATEQSLDADDERDKRKVLIFSYFADTVDWLHDRLAVAVDTDPRLAAYRGRVTSLTGSASDRSRFLWGFAPRTTDAPVGHDEDRFDLVVTTDVLAEGVNLQQARHIINYDLPWNPMRLVQRHGRIDRIGSSHREVFVRCVFPDAQLDDLLGLEERLQRKIKQAAASVGLGEEVLPGSRTEDVVLSETREEIERLRNEDPTILAEGGSGTGALSGEEFRHELRTALADPALATRVRQLPWGAGSGFALVGGEPGYVFCIRIGDRVDPWFRFVTPSGEVIDDTLACLARAAPPDGPTTTRVMDEPTLDGAFDAWSIALDDVVAQWNERSDPANITPSVPRAMRDAAALVREHSTGVLGKEARDRLLDAIEAPYAERLLRQVRAVIHTDEPAARRVQALSELVDDLGLEPPPAPEPLPEITHDDVHLICWLAVVEPKETA